MAHVVFFHPSRLYPPAPAFQSPALFVCLLPNSASTPSFVPPPAARHPPPHLLSLFAASIYLGSASWLSCTINLLQNIICRPVRESFITRLLSLSHSATTRLSPRDVPGMTLVCLAA
ncbi:hypothetical protein IF1G_10039 [Cordyceps javanica]|uniref:Uncharacterized protein n=1 Tax=Cordyceps javanica TaxID=43265 RepID=A0A545UNW3_9HYPO|nr:hypothetical protein IF1G_10039 [Cordyceps javanica]TQW03053.1 hypothetical protein IF2G_09570 [Cordyceps javanica]